MFSFLNKFLLAVVFLFITLVLTSSTRLIVSQQTSSSSTSTAPTTTTTTIVTTTSSPSSSSSSSPSVEYFPKQISIEDIRSKRVTVTFIFPTEPDCGSLCLQTTEVAGRFWSRWVSFDSMVDSQENDQPYGWKTNGDSMCVGRQANCVEQGNASNIVLVQFLPAPDYDLYFPETIAVIFSGRLLPNLVSATEVAFPLTVLPETLSTSPLSYILSIVSVSLHLVTVAMFPFSLDTAGFLLSVSPACTRSYSRNWLPLATFGALPLGGETFGARLWRVGAFLLIAGMLLAAWMTISGTRATDVASARLQATVPLLCAQIALYFLPGLSFGAGALITKTDPLLQVVGVSLIVILCLVMLAIHSWVFRRSTWKYVPVQLPPEEHEQPSSSSSSPSSEAESAGKAILARLERETLMWGFWLDSKEGEEQLNASILPRECRAETQKLVWLQAGFWMLNILTYMISGMTANDVFYCIIQRSGSAVLWLLTAVFVIKVQPFRAGFLNKCSVGIRILTALGTVVQGISPGTDKLVVFTVACISAQLLVTLRIVVNVRGFMTKTKEAVREQLEQDKTEVERMLKQRELELEKAKREEEAAARALEARLESKRRREMRRRGPTLGEIAVGGDPVEFAQNTMDEGESRSQSEMTVEAFNVEGKEPKYLREASRFKPLHRHSTGGSINNTTGATWFPAERPHARTTLEADLPLSGRSFEVRRDEDFYDDDDYRASGGDAGNLVGSRRGHVHQTERLLGHAYHAYSPTGTGMGDDGSFSGL